ncbi:hypothetical protein, partial [Streptococcus pneumoniae]|uniref:hypothetical protein n=1 Tax=Streptococcus pneumoniae TaxID=1313 RepID=UPI00124A4E5E
GPNAIKYVENIETSYTELDDSIYQKRVDEEQKRFDELLNMRGPNAIKYVENIETSYTELDDSIYQKRVDEEQKR